MTAAPLVLVTGAGGFIGGAAVQALRSAGFRVRAGGRRATADFAACDLDKPEEIRAALAGVDLVVHAAYGDIAAMAAQATRLLVQMSDAHAPSLIALSSIAVYGEAEGRVDESTPPRGRLDGYGAAKIACESAVRAWANAPSAPARRATILRPGIVYGTGSKYWIDKLAERIRLGAWADFGAAGDGAAALIHVDDLAAMVVAAARKLTGDQRGDLAPCIAMNAVGPETPNWNRYFQALAESLGAPSLPRWAPSQIARRQRLALGAKIWRRMGLPGARRASLAPTSGEIALFSRKAEYSGESATALLAFQPRLGLRDGLGRTRFD